jgi:hypothetical protein
MPSMMRFQLPPRPESLNHTPIPYVNNLSAKLIDGKLFFYIWTIDFIYSIILDARILIYCFAQETFKSLSTHQNHIHAVWGGGMATNFPGKNADC